VVLAGSGMLLLIGINVLTAWLTLGGLLIYVLVYTLWLKPRTPQNIVIGGLAGALPRPAGLDSNDG
jgi:protoheme IX farnesyltransferase